MLIVPLEVVVTLADTTTLSSETVITGVTSTLSVALAVFPAESANVSTPAYDPESVGVTVTVITPSPDVISRPSSSADRVEVLSVAIS